MTSRFRILIIDDSLLDRAVLANHLSERDFRIFLASGGEDGYQKALGVLPDLILLDVRMPGMDGFATCRRLKADPRLTGIPVIFITAANSVEERVQGLELGAVDYVGKPFDLNEVLARVRIHLTLAARLAAGGKAETPAHADKGGAVDDDEVLCQAALAILRDRLEAPPSTRELAAMVGSHEKQLGRVFQTRLGMTVSGFIREERFMQACKLLAETQIEIQSIALMFGYSSAANFATAFRDRFGTTPGDYRRMRQKSPRRELA